MHYRNGCLLATFVVVIDRPDKVRSIANSTATRVQSLFRRHRVKKQSKKQEEGNARQG